MSDFFKDIKDYEVTYTFYGCERRVSAEDMYQAFKDRLMSETRESTSSMHELVYHDKAWSALVKYVLEHKDDIENEVDDFKGLKPVWEFFNRKCGL